MSYKNQLGFSICVYWCIKNDQFGKLANRIILKIESFFTKLRFSIQHLSYARNLILKNDNFVFEKSDWLLRTY